MVTAAEIQDIEQKLLSANSADVKEANELLRYFGATFQQKVDICTRLNDSQIEWDFTIKKTYIKRKSGGGQLDLKF